MIEDEFDKFFNLMDTKLITTAEALSRITPTKNINWVIENILNGNLNSLKEEETKDPSIEYADENINIYQNKFDNCKSDPEYWQFLSDLKYWQAVKNILLAGNHNNGMVVDIEAPNLNTVLMDVIYHIEKYGLSVLNQTLKFVGNDKT